MKGKIMSNDVWSMDDYDPNQEDLNVGGGVLPGFYHAQIINHKLEPKEKGDCHNIAWEIIGTENDPKKTPMIGRKLYDYLYDYDSCKEMFKRQVRALAVAINYWTRDMLKSAKEQGLPMPAPTFEQFEGRSCIIKVEEEEYEGKKRSKIKGFYAIDSKEAKESGVMINAACGSASAPNDMFD